MGSCSPCRSEIGYVSSQAKSRLSQRIQPQQQQQQKLNPSSIISVANSSKISGNDASILNQELLIKPEEDVFNPSNTRATIVRLSKLSQGKKEPQQISREQCMEQLKRREASENVDGQLKANEHSSTLSLKLTDISMQFQVPACTAGPLIVPSIPYEHYQAEEDQ